MTKAGLVLANGFWVRANNRSQDIGIINEVYHADAYKTYLLFPRRRSNELIIDIGAHIGSFARLWHDKDPTARIVCVETCPENLDALHANVDSFAEKNTCGVHLRGG